VERERGENNIYIMYRRKRKKYRHQGVNHLSSAAAVVSASEPIFQRSFVVVGLMIRPKGATVVAYIYSTHTHRYRHKLVNQTLGAFWYLPCYLHHYTPPHGTTHIVFVYILCTRCTLHVYTQMYLSIYTYYIYTLCSIFNFRVFIM